MSLFSFSCCSGRESPPPPLPEFLAKIDDKRAPPAPRPLEYGYTASKSDMYAHTDLTESTQIAAVKAKELAERAREMALSARILEEAEARRKNTPPPLPAVKPTPALVARVEQVQSIRPLQPLHERVVAYFRAIRDEVIGKPEREAEVARRRPLKPPADVSRTWNEAHREPRPRFRCFSCL